jgi:hypothetical protein
MLKWRGFFEGEIEMFELAWGFRRNVEMAGKSEP